MKKPKRNVAREIIADLKRLNQTLEAGIPLATKFLVRTRSERSRTAESAGVDPAPQIAAKVERPRPKPGQR
jgi:hypothetical protein